VVTGNIIFVRGSSPLSKTIRLFDAGAYSHVAIALSSTHILEAQYYTKSRICPIYFEDYDVINLGLSRQQQLEVMRLGISLVGKWYDYRQIGGYIMRQLFGSDIRKFNNPNNLICSEIIAIILEKSGALEGTYGELEDKTPNELYKILKQYQEKRLHAPSIV